MVIFTEVKNK